MMNRYFLDLARGVSGDMFCAACRSIMDEGAGREFEERLGRACVIEGGRLVVEEIVEGGVAGTGISWDFKKVPPPIAAKDAVENLTRVIGALGLADEAERFALKVMDDIIEAEGRAHGVAKESVHLHELGRIQNTMNIAAAGVCAELLSFEKMKPLASPISIGDGEVVTEHGRLRVPTPASSVLLEGLRFRIGPSEGEMATPTGIAIVRNAIAGQMDAMPGHSRQGIGFGTRAFDGRRGFVRMIEIAEGGGR